MDIFSASLSDILIVLVPLDLGLAALTAWLLSLKGRDFLSEFVRYFLAYLIGTPFVALWSIPRAALRRPDLDALHRRQTVSDTALTVDSAALAVCKACHKPIRSTARICPHCQTLLWR